MLQQAPPATQTTASFLTERQLQVVACLAAGLTVKQAATELGIAYGTASLYLHCARRRTRLKTTDAIIAASVRAGLV